MIPSHFFSSAGWLDTTSVSTMRNRSSIARKQRRRRMRSSLSSARSARDSNDLTTERAALEALLSHDPGRAQLRAELNVVIARQNPSASTLRVLHVNNTEVNAVLDALDGKRDAAAATLALSASPIARGDAGILL